MVSFFCGQICFRKKEGYGMINRNEINRISEVGYAITKCSDSSK